MSSLCSDFSRNVASCPLNIKCSVLTKLWKSEPRSRCYDTKWIIRTWLNEQMDGFSLMKGGVFVSIFSSSLIRFSSFSRLLFQPENKDAWLFELTSVVSFLSTFFLILGQERYGNMTRVYYREAVGALVVFDMTRLSTFQAVLKWKGDLDSKVKYEIDVLCLV